MDDAIESGVRIEAADDDADTEEDDAAGAMTTRRPVSWVAT